MAPFCSQRDRREWVTLRWWLKLLRSGLCRARSGAGEPLVDLGDAHVPRVRARCPGMALR